MKWKTPRYVGKYYRSGENMTMRESFDLFNLQFDDMAEEIMRGFLRSYGYK